eukprot:jgi/Ulvmu1/1888/UM012_0045.1
MTRAEDCLVAAVILMVLGSLCSVVMGHKREGGKRNGTSPQIWEAIEAKDAATVRNILAHDPRQAVIPHPTTQLSPFTTAMRARATDQEQDSQLAQIMVLLLGQATDKRLMGPCDAHAAADKELEGVPPNRHERALIITNLERIMAGSSR